MFELLSYPFMIRALIAGLVAGVLLAALGVLVVVRRMAFFGDGVAHASLAGIALALLVGVAPLPVAIAWAVLIALGIYWLERSTYLSADTIIGIFVIVFMALGVVIMSIIPGFQPELISFLFGNILTITNADVYTTLAAATGILLWLGIWRKQILFASLDPDAARVSGVKVERQTIILYITLAASIVLGVKLLGIILVSALLLIPAATSRLMTHTFYRFFWVAILVSILSVLLGLFASFWLDIHSGATIILVSTLGFALVAIGHKIFPSS